MEVPESRNFNNVHWQRSLSAAIDRKRQSGALATPTGPPEKETAASEGNRGGGGSRKDQESRNYRRVQPASSGWHQLGPPEIETAAPAGTGSGGSWGDSRRNLEYRNAHLPSTWRALGDIVDHKFLLGMSPVNSGGQS